MTEEYRFFLLALAYTLAITLAAATLTACSDMKYAECVLRDRTSNPCN